MDVINQVKKLVSEINRLHFKFSNDYFETGKIDKINLSRTIQHVPVPHIYHYRLTLHESVNDYLMTANIDIKYFYRVKTRESIDDVVQKSRVRKCRPLKRHLGHGRQLGLFKPPLHHFVVLTHRSASERLVARLLGPRLIQTDFYIVK